MLDLGLLGSERSDQQLKDNCATPCLVSGDVALRGKNGDRCHVLIILFFVGIGDVDHEDVDDDLVDHDADDCDHDDVDHGNIDPGDVDQDDYDNHRG